jgi:hypothetical protein
MKIGLLTVSHKRPTIDRCYCLMVERLMVSFPGLFIPVVVVSIEEEKKTFEEFGIETYLYKNNPVGEKHNFILEKLRGRCTHVMHIGSDDIIDNNYAAMMIANSENDIVWGRGISFYSVKKKCARYWDEPYRNVAGPGKLISAGLLDRVNWHIWDDNVDQGLDHTAFKTMEPFIESRFVFNVKNADGLYVDIKSEVNINSYDRFAGCGKELGVDYIFNRISKKESDYLKSLN